MSKSVRSQLVKDRVRSGFKTCGPSLTEQSHTRACDINTIMARYQKTGIIDHVSKYADQYGDISAYDFAHAQNLVAQVKSQFEELPAYVRAEFENDPQNYLALMETNEGLSKLRSIIHPADQYDKEGNVSPEAAQAVSEDISKIVSEQLSKNAPGEPEEEC